MLQRELSTADILIQSPGLQNYEKKYLLFWAHSLWYLLWKLLKTDTPANEMGIVTLIGQMKT